MREIPTVADYAHWNEEAEAVWYEENRYDLMYGGEDAYDDDPNYDYDLSDPDTRAWYGEDSYDEEDL